MAEVEDKRTTLVLKPSDQAELEFIAQELENSDTEATRRSIRLMAKVLRARADGYGIRLVDETDASRPDQQVLIL